MRRAFARSIDLEEMASELGIAVSSRYRSLGRFLAECLESLQYSGLSLPEAADQLLASEDKDKVQKLVEELRLNGCLVVVRQRRKIQARKRKEKRPVRPIRQKRSSLPAVDLDPVEELYQEAIRWIGNRGALIDEADRGITPQGTRQRLEIPETPEGLQAWQKLLKRFSLTESQLFT